jgi:hypothetical protein
MLCCHAMYVTDLALVCRLHWPSAHALARALRGDGMEAGGCAELDGRR